MSWPKGDSIPGPKEVVDFLCKSLRRTEEPSARDPTKFVKYVYFACPMGALCKSRGKNSEFRCPQASGRQNGIIHLISCVGKGSHLPVLELYNKEKLNATRQSKLGEHFAPMIMPVSLKEKELMAWLELIIMKSQPLNIVEDPIYRGFSAATNSFSIKTVRAVILALVPLVEKLIAAEMKEAEHGAIMSDAWSKFSTHYFGLYATYNKTIKHSVGDVLRETLVPQIVLLGMSPLTSYVEEKEDDDRDTVQATEATNFKAEVLVQFCTKKFSYYDINFDTWVKCETSDNCSVNKKMARLMKKPHLACMNHLLSSEVEHMVDASRAEGSALGVADVVDKVHKTMSDAKGSIKNAAVLRTLTKLRPSMANGVKWSSKATMMRKFDRIRSDVIVANESEDCDISIDTSNNFEAAARKTGLMFQEINSMTVAMQTRLYPVKDCREDLDTLIEEAENNLTRSQSCWFRNKLGIGYIGSDSEKQTDPDFVNGVVKIQRGEEGALTPAEKRACKSLETTSPEDDADGPLSLEEKMKKKHRKRKAGLLDNGRKSRYLNVDYICGSAAEVERLWSICKYVITTNRSSLTPILLEALLFLRVNRSFWDLRLVQEAHANAINDSRNARLAKDIADDDAFLEDEIQNEDFS